MPVPPPSRFRGSGERRHKAPAVASCPPASAAVLGFHVFPPSIGGAEDEGGLRKGALLLQPAPAAAAGLLSLQFCGRLPIGRLRVVRGGSDSDDTTDEDAASNYGDELPAAAAESPGGGACWPAGGALSPASPPIRIPPPGADSRRFVRAAQQARALLNSRLSQGA